MKKSDKFYCPYCDRFIASRFSTMKTHITSPAHRRSQIAWWQMYYNLSKTCRPTEFFVPGTVSWNRRGFCSSCPAFAWFSKDKLNVKDRRNAVHIIRDSVEMKELPAQNTDTPPTAATTIAQLPIAAPVPVPRPAPAPVPAISLPRPQISLPTPSIQLPQPVQQTETLFIRTKKEVSQEERESGDSLTLVSDEEPQFNLQEFLSAKSSRAVPSTRAPLSPH